jgi:hypothetical protein
MASKTKNVNRKVKATVKTGDKLPTDKTVAEVADSGKLYFFPTIQKSVVATSMEDAIKQVQPDLNTLNEGTN